MIRHNGRLVSHRVAPDAPSGKARLRQGPCSVPNCNGSANDLKGYCDEHLDRLPYVKRILDKLAEHPELRTEPSQRRLPAKVRKKLPPDRTGMVCGIWHVRCHVGYVLNRAGKPTPKRIYVCACECCGKLQKLTDPMLNLPPACDSCGRRKRG